MPKNILEIPPSLDRILAAPVLLYRRLRYGYTFRRIRLAAPRYAKVDPQDYHRLRKYEWLPKKGCNRFYAVRYCRIRPGNPSTFFIHHEILRAPPGMVVDHINHDGLDTRRANLRIATRAQNAANRCKDTPATSKYKGVHWHKGNQKWAVDISLNRKRIHLGYFDNEIDAAKAYDHAAKIHHRQFAVFNLPQTKPSLLRRAIAAITKSRK